MESLFRSPLLSDINLVLINSTETNESEQIPAHKAILANRSNYFRSLFNFNSSLAVNKDDKPSVELNLTELGSIKTALEIIEKYIYGAEQPSSDSNFLYQNVNLINFLLIDGQSYKLETLDGFEFTVTRAEGTPLVIVDSYHYTCVSWCQEDDTLTITIYDPHIVQVKNFLLSFLPDFIPKSESLGSYRSQLFITNQDHVAIILYQLYTLGRIRRYDDGNDEEKDLYAKLIYSLRSHQIIE